MTYNLTAPVTIDAGQSYGYTYDAARGCLHPTRSQSVSVADLPFDSLSSWTNISAAGASATITNPGDPDPAIGNVLDLQTGGTVGVSAGVQRTLGTIPASFGMLVIPSLHTVGSNADDALHIYVQADNGWTIPLRFRLGQVDVFQGGWQPLFSHGPTGFCEWWVEAQHNGSGNYTVSIYAGTALCAQRTGGMPWNWISVNNRVLIEQHSGANNNRRSKVALMQIGATQLPDAMRLTSAITTPPAPVSRADLMILVENVCESVAGLSASLSADDGATWEPVTLTDGGHQGAGLIDPAKSIRAMTGGVTFAASENALRWRVETAAGSFLPVRGVVEVT